jgi:hypothetical protein
LKELSAEVKSVKVALRTISKDVTRMRGEYQSLPKAIENLISEGLNRMKSEILEGLAKGTIQSVPKSVPESVPKSVPRRSSNSDGISERDKILGAAINLMAEGLGCGDPKTSPNNPINVVQVVDSADQTPVKERRSKRAQEAVRRQPQRKVRG